jgi:prepilin peptidase CpaA
MIATLVLLCGAALLLYIAYLDLTEFRIRNTHVAALAALYFAYAFAAGQLATIPAHMLLATVALAGMLLAYRLGGIGGGDVKLMAACILWSGRERSLLLVVLLLFAVAVQHGAFRLKWGPSMVDASGRNRLPLAPPLAVATIGAWIAGHALQV